MPLFLQFRGHETESDILDKIVYCSEFSEFYLRKDEKKTLNDIKDDGNGKRIRHQIPGKITNKQQKASWLVFAIFHGDQIIVFREQIILSIQYQTAKPTDREFKPLHTAMPANCSEINGNIFD